MTYSMPFASMIYLSGVTMPSVSRIYLSGIWEVLVMIITLLTSADRRKPILPYSGKCVVAKRIVHDKVQTDREVLESEIQE